MSELEIILLVLVIFYQITLWIVLALQQRMNTTVKEVLELLGKKEQQQ